MPATAPLNLAILILAAGTSKRMGSPKQLLPWGDTTLLNHAIAQAEKTGIPQVTVVLGAYADQIKDSIQSPTVEIINHKLWHSGLGSSIAYGIDQVTKNTSLDGLMIMLADQPDVDTEYLNAMIKLFSPSKQQIIASKYSNQIGVPAIFDVYYTDELCQLDGDSGAKQVIKKYAASVTAYSTGNELVDIDDLVTYNMLFKSHFSHQ